MSIGAKLKAVFKRRTAMPRVALRDLPVLIEEVGGPATQRRFEAVVKQITAQIRADLKQFEEEVATVEYSAECGANIVGWLKTTSEELTKKLKHQTDVLK